MELKKIADKTANILLIDANAAIRQVKSSALKDQGFTSVTQCPDIKMGISVLEAEKIDWVICNFSIFDGVSALNLLQLVDEHEQINHILVSFFVSPVETEYLPTAFSLNLFSFHITSSNSEDSVREVDQLIARCDDNAYDSILVAASYLRDNLTELKDWKLLAEWQESFYKSYPGIPEILLSMGEAYKNLGKPEDAKKAIKQACWSSPALSTRASSLMSDIGKSVGGDSISSINALGFESCLIIVESESTRSELSKILNESGIPEVTSVETVDESLDKLRSGYKPELILFDWHNSCPGPVLIQKIKAIPKLEVPLIVISPMLREQDQALINELGIDGHIKSVGNRRGVVETLIKCARQGRTPTLPLAILRQIRILFKNRKAGKAMPLINQYNSLTGVKEGDRIQVEAEFAFHTSRYKVAKNLGMQALRSGGEPLAALNIVGKAMLKLNEFQGAKACLENARMISPFNLERICQLAEAHLCDGDEEEYESLLDTAKDIDANSQNVLETQAKKVILTSDSEEVSEIFGRLVSLSGIVSFTNNQAITKIRCGEFDEGLKLYERVISATPKGRKDIFAIIHYNYAMAYVRMGRNDEALDMLIKANGFGNARVQKKVSSLAAKVKKAKKENGKVQLNTELQPDEKFSKDASNEEYCLQNDLIRGVVKVFHKCCGHTFESPKPMKEIVTILEKKPHFKSCGTLVRDSNFSGLKNAS